MSNSRLRTRFGLRDRVYVVTGGSSGIGKAMAEFLVEADARVTLIARREELLYQAKEDIGPDRCEAIPADLTDLESIPDIAERCLNRYRRVDGVINAAGVNLRQPWDEVTPDSWDRTHHLNLAVPFFLSRCFIAGMRERKFGRIINIASLQSERAFPNGLVYGASKAGVCQLTRAMAEAWSRYGITCNAISPGFFPTELTAPVFSRNETRDWAAGQTTMGRNGEMEDLAGATIFLAAPASGYITGQVLAVDGGFTAR